MDEHPGRAAPAIRGEVTEDTASDPGSPTDAQVIEQSLRSPEAFATLFDRHAGAIYRYAAIRLGTNGADDVMSETFYLAFRGRRRYDLSRDNARPWLYGIATHVVSHRRRIEARHLRALSRTTEPIVHEAPDDAVAERVSAQAARAELATALIRLPRRYRDVLLLVALADLDYAEAAAALDIPVGTVRSRLHRARQSLRAELARRDPNSLGRRCRDG